MTFRLANISGRAALVEGDHYYDLATITAGAIGPDPMTAVASFADLHEIDLSSHEPTGLLLGAAVGPPVPRPVNCFGIGLNYRSHVAEANMEMPTHPVVFTKFPGCISPPDSKVEIHGDAVDYEAELVVAIGTGGRAIVAADAWAHVAGVMAGQDISDRVLQFAASPVHFDLGKSRDTYGPIGPALVSVDSLPDPDAIELSCQVNGELRQQASTDELIFSVPFLIEYLSQVMTLHPGDLIFTGTPEGVGMASGNLLRAGDVITTTVGGVGVLTNRCVPA